MGSLSIWHWMIVLLVVLLLFGSGKVSNLMGDFAKGIKAFKKNLAEDESMEAGADRPAGSIAAPGGAPTLSPGITPAPGAAAPQPAAQAEREVAAHRG